MRDRADLFTDERIEEGWFPSIRSTNDSDISSFFHEVLFIVYSDPGESMSMTSSIVSDHTVESDVHMVSQMASFGATR